MKIDETKKKILNAAKKLMSECKDVNEVTARAISKEAGVQLSMINYCFGSKENMLYIIFEKILEDYLFENKNLIEILETDYTPKEKLRYIHYIIAECLIENYKYTKALTGFFLLHRDMSKPQNSLPFVIEHYKGRKSVEECKLISYELSSIMQLAIYRNQELKELAQVDFNNKEELHKFIDMQIELFLVD